ncbi:MAG: MlaD family protein [Pseudomonadota bacterium]|nr:MlaD family protein [Pseudomonadota bacterium]
MENRAHYFIVGLFVLVLVGAVTGFATWLARIDLEENKNLYNIFFSGSVTGLAPGSPVRYRGVSVGNVVEIRIAPDAIEYVRVLIEVQPDTPIKTDSVAALETIGITGGIYVQITGGSQDASLLVGVPGGPVPVIESRPSTISELFDSAPQLLKGMMEIMDKANTFLSEANKESITGILANVDTVTGGLAEAVPDITEGAASLKAGIENLDRLIDELRDQAAVIGASIDDSADEVVAEAKAMHETLEKTAKSIRASADSFNDMSSGIDAMVAENREPVRTFFQQGLYELELLMGDLRTLSNHLSRISARIERDPRDFIFGGTEQGVEVRK